MAEKFRSMQHTDVTDPSRREHKTKMGIKGHIDIFNANITRKAVMRYMTIVMDFSVGSLKQDLRPNRAIVMKDKISVSLPASSPLTH